MQQSSVLLLIKRTQVFWNAQKLFFSMFLPRLLCSEMVLALGLQEAHPSRKESGERGMGVPSGKDDFHGVFHSGFFWGVTPRDVQRLLLVPYSGIILTLLWYPHWLLHSISLTPNKKIIYKRKILSSMVKLIFY